MIGTIVVPLDGSKLSERAIVYARAFAERSGAPVLLTRIAQVDADETEIEQIRDYLRQVSRSIPGRVQIEVARGRPGEKIVDIAEQVLDPVIIMSTHGRGGLRRWLTGSVADEVVRTAGVPVLLIRPEHELPETIEIQNILLPLDGSRYAETAIDYAREVARLFKSTIHLVRVVDTPSVYAMFSRHMEVAVTGEVLEELVQSMVKEAEEYLSSVAATLENVGISVKQAVLEGYPGEELIDYERKGYFQLVVMATAGRGGISRIIFGSVAERMLKMGRTPVMMMRPREVEDSVGSE